MVNVEADNVAGPLLAREAAQAGVVYSLAYGDQPALICELVDWARACGFTVIAAGKGTKYLPEYHASTPETVWGYHGLTPRSGAQRGHEPADVQFLPGWHEIRHRDGSGGQRHRADAGRHRTGCVSRPAARMSWLKCCGPTLRRDRWRSCPACIAMGDVANDLRWGVYVVFEAPTGYTVRCFQEYGVATDASGRVSALSRPFHLIGLE